MAHVYAHMRTHTRKRTHEWGRHLDVLQLHQRLVAHVVCTAQHGPRCCRVTVLQHGSAPSAAVVRQRPGTEAPAHLDGTLAGDFGFDPLNLGQESFKLK